MKFYNNLYKLPLPNYIFFLFIYPDNFDDFTNSGVHYKLKKSYSIFRRTTGFGKLDSLFLFFRRVFSAVSAASFCLLLVPPTGLPKGETNFISTAGGDQEPCVLVVL